MDNGRIKREFKRDKKKKNSETDDNVRTVL